MINPNYQFETKKYQKLWQDEIKNIDKNIKYIYKDRDDLRVILSNYRKVFKITPAKIKSLNIDSEHIQFIIYLALNFTNISKETLINELNITSDDIDKPLKSNQDFQDKIKIFFEPLKEGYLSNKKAVFAMQEEIFLKNRKSNITYFYL